MNQPESDEFNQNYLNDKMTYSMFHATERKAQKIIKRNFRFARIPSLGYDDNSIQYLSPDYIEVKTRCVVFVCAKKMEAKNFNKRILKRAELTIQVRKSNRTKLKSQATRVRTQNPFSIQRTRHCDIIHPTFYYGCLSVVVVVIVVVVILVVVVFFIVVVIVSKVK